MSLVISDLNKSFSLGLEPLKILQNMQLNLKTGEVVAILGQSGSGKSTLLSLLAGLDKVDSGHILVDNTDLTKLSESQMTTFRAQNIGIVFQQYHLVSHLTALENVMLPLEILNKPEAQKLATELLTDVGLEHRLEHFPAQMSGGENQRVAIARALVVQPKLLLADEPSGNLDIQTGQKVMKLFFESVRKQQTTTLLVTHNEELAKLCDRVFYLKNGQLVGVQ